MSEGTTLKVLPLTIEEYIKQYALDTDMTEFEIRVAYINYLVINKDSHHYGAKEHMCKWLSSQEYDLI